MRISFTRRAALSGRPSLAGLKASPTVYRTAGATVSRKAGPAVFPKVGATVVVIAALLAVSTLAQSPQFVLSSRDRANLLAVDFVATGPGGVPVYNLTATDVSIRVGGRARRVVALEYVRPETRTASAGAHLQPFGDNAERHAPRSIVLVVDEDTIQPGRTITVRDAARRLLAGLSPADRVALVTVPFGGLAVDLTTDHTRVLQAMGSLTAKGLRSESAADAQCRTLNTLGAITDTMLRLSAVEDPVTVVFFSSGQAAPQSIIRMTGNAPVAGPCDLRASNFTDLGNAAARARARFYVVHSDLDQRNRGLDGLEHITGVTGGPLLHLATNDGIAAVSRILEETAGHYVARVSRESSDIPGETVAISVSTSKPDVTLWRSPRFVVTRPGAVAAVPTTTLDVMKLPWLLRDLPLRITGHTFRADEAGMVRLAVTLESPDADTTLSGAMVGVFDAEGRMVSGLEMSSEALTRRPVVATLPVPPGTYRVRLAALESTGRAGSAEQQVDAFLTPIGALHASSLMIGLSRAGAFVPQMAFTNEPTAFGLLELYGTFVTPPRVTFEIAATANGPAIETMPGLVEPTSDRTRSLVTTVLPIETLAVGDYVVRATITPDGASSGRVTRVLRKIGLPRLSPGPI